MVHYFHLCLFYFQSTCFSYYMISYCFIYYSKMFSILQLWEFPIHLLSLFLFLDRIFFDYLEIFCTLFVFLQICRAFSRIFCFDFSFIIRILSNDFISYLKEKTNFSCFPNPHFDTFTYFSSVFLYFCIFSLHFGLLKAILFMCCGYWA